MVVINMSGATDKARIAKGQNFSSSIQHSMATSLVGDWNFDEGTGTTANDISGMNNNGTLFNSPTWKTNKVDCISGSCLSLDGINDYIDCGNDPSLNIINAVSVEMWLYLSSDLTAYMRIIDHDGPSQFVITGASTSPFSRIMWRIGAWAPECISNSIISLKSWHHIVATFSDTDDKAKIFIDGNFDKEIANTNKLSATNKNLFIGRYTDGGYFFNGTIDGVRIYNSALPASAIRENYIAGMDKLLAGGRITKEDYQKRLADLNSTYAANE